MEEKEEEEEEEEFDLRSGLLLDLTVILLQFSIEDEEEAREMYTGRP